MSICSRCVLPDTFPGISFDDQGVCNYCRNMPVPDSDEKQAYRKNSKTCSRTGEPVTPSMCCSHTAEARTRPIRSTS